MSYLVNVQTPVNVQAPRGAEWIGTQFARLLNAFIPATSEAQGNLQQSVQQTRTVADRFEQRQLAHA
jgi:hypothetical protein